MKAGECMLQGLKEAAYLIPVGVSVRADEEELSLMSSSYFMVPQFSDMATIVEDVVNTSCTGKTSTQRLTLNVIYFR